MAIKEFLGSHDSFKINYIDAWQFEIGECYMDHRNIVYLLDPKYGKFASNMRNILNNITYEDERMELFFSAAIPHILKYFETTAGEYCIIIRKPKETYPLRAVLKYFKGEIDVKHVAWIIQRLLDIEKFLNYNNIVHNGISIDNIFISPINHIVTIYGGWWYATPQGEKMIGTNTEIFNLMSKETKEDKLSTCYTDLVSIKNIGRNTAITPAQLAVSTIDAATALFTFLFCNFSTYGFNAQAITYDAKNNSNIPAILGIMNSRAIIETKNKIFLTVKNDLNIQISP